MRSGGEAGLRVASSSRFTLVLLTDCRGVGQGFFSGIVGPARELGVGRAKVFNTEIAESHGGPRSWSGFHDEAPTAVLRALCDRARDRRHNVDGGAIRAGSDRHFEAERVSAVGSFLGTLEFLIIWQ
jgi:hypothetical protein